MLFVLLILFIVFIAGGFLVSHWLLLGLLIVAALALSGRL